MFGWFRATSRFARDAGANNILRIDLVGESKVGFAVDDGQWTSVIGRWEPGNQTKRSSCRHAYVTDYGSAEIDTKRTSFPEEVFVGPCRTFNGNSVSVRSSDQQTDVQLVVVSFVVIEHSCDPKWAIADLPNGVGQQPLHPGEVFSTWPQLRFSHPHLSADDRT